MEGQSLREHLLTHYRRTGVLPAMLANAPELPEGMEVLWNDFLALHGSRGHTMSGPARITFSDIDAYQRVTGASLQPWEINAIRGADNAYLTVQAEQREASRND